MKASGTVTFVTGKGWRARLVGALPDGTKWVRESFHHSPMAAGLVLKAHREDLRLARSTTSELSR